MKAMNNLVVMKNQQAVTDSLTVAKSFEKEHRNVLKRARNLTAQNGAVEKMSFESTYINQQGHDQPLIYMNRDGFTLLTMSFTGKKALEFKLKYIQAFNAMEEQIRQPKEERLEIMKHNSATKRAGMLYKIAMATDSNVSKQKLLRQATHALTGEQTIPVMQDKYFAVEEVGQKLNLSADAVDRIACQIRLKAEYSGQNQYGSWINDEWFYTKQGIELIDMYSFVGRIRK